MKLKTCFLRWRRIRLVCSKKKKRIYCSIYLQNFPSCYWILFVSLFLWQSYLQFPWPDSFSPEYRARIILHQWYSSLRSILDWLLIFVLIVSRICFMLHGLRFQQENESTAEVTTRQTTRASVEYTIWMVWCSWIKQSFALFILVKPEFAFALTFCFSENLLHPQAQHGQQLFYSLQRAAVLSILWTNRCHLFYRCTPSHCL